MVLPTQTASHQIPAFKERALSAALHAPTWLGPYESTRLALHAPPRLAPRGLTRPALRPTIRSTPRPTPHAAVSRHSGFAALPRRRWGFSLNAIFAPAHRANPRWYKNRFLICFFAGLLSGTAAANFFYASLNAQACYYLNLLSRRLTLGREERLSLFGTVCRQRIIETLVVWLMGLTAYAVPCFCLLCFGMGFSMGLLLSVMTGQMGLMGLPFFMASIMPQALCYVPGACLFLWWSVRGARGLKLAGLLLVLVAVIGGSACEVWANPLILRFAGTFF